MEEEKFDRKSYESIIEKLQRENEYLRMSKLKDMRESISVNLSSVEEFLQEHWHISLFLLATAVSLLQIVMRKGDKS